MYIAMYCCILRNESGLWHTFSDKIFLENFLENFLEKIILLKGVFVLWREKERQQEKFL